MKLWTIDYLPKNKNHSWIRIAQPKPPAWIIADQVKWCKDYESDGRFYLGSLPWELHHTWIFEKGEDATLFSLRWLGHED